MGKIEVLEEKNNHIKEYNEMVYKSKSHIKKVESRTYTIYTKKIIEKYKDSSKIILKLSNDKTKTKFMMYNKVWRWYEKEKNINLSMEKIYIRTKLGSYTSGGCGIGASLFAGLTASGVFSYMDKYIKKLNPYFLTIYLILVLIFGIKVLSNEDNKVEMYNMFLEVLNNLEDDKSEK